MENTNKLMIAVLSTVVVTGMSVSAALAAGSWSRSPLYATSTLNGICAEAQRIVTSSDLSPINAVYSPWAGFVQSDAEPYSVIGGSTPLDYSPPEAPDRPLRSTQHLFFDAYRLGGGEFASVVSCKMKNAEYLNARDPDLGAIDQPCKAVHEYYVGQVLTGMPKSQFWRVLTKIRFDDDVTAERGSEWTEGFPDNPYPVLYRESEGGPIHIKASALYVPPHPDTVPFGAINFIEACNLFGGPDSFLGSACEPRKWGVRYCHLASPEYMHAALTGKVDVPTCGTSSADPRVCP